MSHYSFPLLPMREIKDTLAELKIVVTEEELKEPAGWKIKGIYEQLIELLLAQWREDMVQPAFAGMDELEFPELHEDSVPMMAFLKAWSAAVASLRAPRHTTVRRRRASTSHVRTRTRGSARGSWLLTLATPRCPPSKCLTAHPPWRFCVRPPAVAHSNKLLSTSGVDFTLADITKPDPKRLRRNLSAIINFTKVHARGRGRVHHATH